MRKKIRSFLRIENEQANQIVLQNLTDFETAAYINKVWSWGDKQAIEQMYKQMLNESIGSSFWNSVPAFGIIKRHTGIPGMMVNVLTDIIIADMNDIIVSERETDWNEIKKELPLQELITDAVKDTMVVGDGAFIISINTDESKYPKVEFVSGECLEYVYVRGRIKEVKVKTLVSYNSKSYVLEETYGYGYVNTALYDEDKEVPLATVPAYGSIEPKVEHDKTFMMAVPLMFAKSSRYKGRGKSIYEGKTDNFDSLDETWSQWMDALRKGRTKEYIPESLLPRNPETGEPLKPNAYDHAFIMLEGNMSERANNKIDNVQPDIPHESYLSTYITALDLCLQGVISPSTLGIDTKKLDNAEAQREKEKATLYTRNKIVSALQDKVPELIDTIFKVYDCLNKRPLRNTKVECPFGEYANPSFESQVETVSKAKTGGIMSTEAAVDELYGDSKDETWKKNEVARIKAEQGITELEEPSVNTEQLIAQNT